MRLPFYLEGALQGAAAALLALAALYGVYALGLPMLSEPLAYLAGRSYSDNAAAGATLDAPNLGTVALAGETDYDGQATLTLSDERFGYNRPLAPIGPSGAAVDLDLAGADLTDTDGVCHHPLDASCNINDAVMNVAQPYAVSGIVGTTLRFGRLELGMVPGADALHPLVVDLDA